MGQCMGAPESEDPYARHSHAPGAPALKPGAPPPVAFAKGGAAAAPVPAPQPARQPSMEPNPLYPTHGANPSIVEGLAGAYKVIRLLGSGIEGNTYLVKDVATDKMWAIKLIQLPLPGRLIKSLHREIKLQSELGEGHVNIVTTEEVVLTTHYLGLVMEYAPGGVLTAYLMKRMRENRTTKGLLLQEDEARYYFRQITHAVAYCHRHHVAHRDLKLDNTLLTDDKPPVIKLCDFGFARGWDQSAHFTTVLGTPDYMSPQIASARAKYREEEERIKQELSRTKEEAALRKATSARPTAFDVPEAGTANSATAGDGSGGSTQNGAHDSANSPVAGQQPQPDLLPQLSGYDGAKADVWALGVLLCVMVTSRFPFEAGGVTSTMEEEQLSKISNDVMTQVWLQQKKALSRGSWCSSSQMKGHLPLMSAPLKDLLDKIFELDETKRIDVAGIKAHPWFNGPLRPEHQQAMQKLEKSQLVTDSKILSGSFHSEQRDRALSELMELASSEEFKEKALAPVTPDSTFQLWSRIGLRTALDSYFVPNMKSLQELIAESENLSTRFACSRSMMEVKPCYSAAGRTPPATQVLYERPEEQRTGPDSSGRMPIPSPSNKPAKPIFRPRPELGFRSLLHGSGGETMPVRGSSTKREAYGASQVERRSGPDGLLQGRRGDSAHGPPSPAPLEVADSAPVPVTLAGG